MMNLVEKIKRVKKYINTAVIQTVEVIRLAKAKDDVDFKTIGDYLKEYYDINAEIKMVSDPLNMTIPHGIGGVYLVEENTILINTAPLGFTLNKIDNDTRVLLAIIHEICHAVQAEKIGADEFAIRMYDITDINDVDMKEHDKNELEIEANNFAKENITKHLHLLRKHRQ